MGEMKGRGEAFKERMKETSHSRVVWLQKFTESLNNPCQFFICWYEGPLVCHKSLSIGGERGRENVGQREGEKVRKSEREIIREIQSRAGRNRSREGVGKKGETE